MNIIFLGAGAFGIPALEAVAASTHRVLQIVTQPDRPAGRGKQLAETPIAQTAGAYGWPVIKTDNVNSPEMLAQLRALAPDVLVVVAFGQKLSDELLGIAPDGGINLHSSLLPKYRGAAPINWAVINHDPVAGACVIEVTSVMDGGAILAEASTAVGPAETAGELHDRLAQLGAPLLPGVLDQLAAGTVQRRAQDSALATRAPKLRREMAWVDWAQPAAVVSARIRGMSPWPGVAVELVDAAGLVRTQATILKCEATADEDVHAADRHGVVLADRSIACGVGSLRIITIQPAGKRPMDIGAFANGYGLASGARLRGVLAVPGG